jgi:hypothetical protein
LTVVEKGCSVVGDTVVEDEVVGWLVLVGCVVVDEDKVDGCVVVVQGLIVVVGHIQRIISHGQHRFD